MSTRYKAKKILRYAKNISRGYSEIEIKVREATSNDPWGPSSKILAEIANATHDRNQFGSVMEILRKRMNDKGKNWRHVLKALTVLDYLIQSGSENVGHHVRDNIFMVKTLRQFQYIDEHGTDHGLGVRQKTHDIICMLDDTHLRDHTQESSFLLGESQTGSSPGHTSWSDNESPANPAADTNISRPEPETHMQDLIGLFDEPCSKPVQTSTNTMETVDWDGVKPFDTDPLAADMVDPGPVSSDPFAELATSAQQSLYSKPAANPFQPN